LKKGVNFRDIVLVIPNDCPMQVRSGIFIAINGQALPEKARFGLANNSAESSKHSHLSVIAFCFDIT
jgi:hypothetical protein